jgi:hypothetical protein
MASYTQLRKKADFSSPLSSSNSLISFAKVKSSKLGSTLPVFISATAKPSLNLKGS